MDVGLIIGDGIGRDVVPVAVNVIDAAVAKAYSDRKIEWHRLPAGEEAMEKGLEPLPKETLDRIRDLKLVLKGPLTTPVGKGFRSLNVALRQEFDLYSCIRPVKHYADIPAPLKSPEKLNVVIFRENTEDVYAGIEFKKDSEGAKKLISDLGDMGYPIRHDSGIGIKPISETGSKRLVLAAFKHAVENNRKVVTLVHKGNIMKFTEGSFKEWGYQAIKDNYPDKAVFESELEGEVPEGKILVNDRIADAMFQQLLIHPEDYEVVATTNLNGDYLSDAAAAQIGGLGLAPGGNVGEDIAIFEATHGSAPKMAGEDKANPSSVLLSGVMMLRHIGWNEAADLIETALEKTFRQKTVTYDLERQMENAKKLKCSEFGEAVIKNL